MTRFQGFETKEDAIEFVKSHGGLLTYTNHKAKWKGALIIQRVMVKINVSKNF